MELVQIYPRGNLQVADTFLLSVLFTKNELLSMGVNEGQIEVSDLYIDDDEFNKLYKLWKDPSYLDDFFEENQEFFDDEYWNNITKRKFIADVTSSAPVIFAKIRTLFDENKLDEMFKPLDNIDESKEDYTSIRVKSKFGSINRRIAFRIYAVKIENGCYIITGGAIKISKDMLKAPNTHIELNKINSVYAEFGTFDDRASFIDFILEE